MSTSFYTLRSPITSVRVGPFGFGKALSIWLNGQHAGRLIVLTEELPAILAIFARDVPVAIRSNDKVDWLGNAVHPDTILVSEYGELTTAGELQGNHQ